jgi:5-methylcytosine-specific restriction endonuclease McrA
MLNNSYEAISVCSVKKAILLTFLQKAEIVAYRKNEFINSVSNKFPAPSVIKLSKYMKLPFRRIELSRRNIYRRDNYQCQYCGKKTQVLTIDHIIPRSRGGEDTWENLVTACDKCNNMKGSRTPEEAGMQLLKIPSKIHHIIFMKLNISDAEEAWKPFLYMD